MFDELSEGCRPDAESRVPYLGEKRTSSAVQHVKKLDENAGSVLEMQALSTLNFSLVLRSRVKKSRAT